MTLDALANEIAAQAKAEADSIRVFVNGTLNHDWLYTESENTVYFTVIPSAGELVEVGYRYIEPDTGA